LGVSLIANNHVPALTPFPPHTSKPASDILYAPLLLIAPVNHLLPSGNKLGQDARRASGSGLLPCNLTPEPHFAGRKSLL
jgi:hypothetical protein